MLDRSRRSLAAVDRAVERTTSRSPPPAPVSGVDPAQVAAEVDVVLEQVLAAERRGPAGPRGLAGVQGRKGRDGAHRGAQPDARGDAGRRPRPPRGAVVTACPSAPTCGRGHGAAAASVVDPELPMLTLVDLGVLRDVAVDEDGAVVAAITPTYSGCPAMATMRDDLVRTLQDAGFADVRVRVALRPRLDDRLDHPGGQGRSSRRRHLPTGTGPGGRARSPLRWRRPAARCAVPAAGPTTSPSPLSSGPPPARPCTGAAPVSSRSTT